MNITELLVTGYDGDKAVFAATLRHNEAKVVLTTTNDDGTLVDSAWEQAVESFAELRELMERVVATRVPAS